MQGFSVLNSVDAHVGDSVLEPSFWHCGAFYALLCLLLELGLEQILKQRIE